MAEKHLKSVCLMIEMEIKHTKSGIEFEKELNDLDRFVLDFIKNIKIKYVLVSGYVSILFGRARGSEDVDIFIEKLDKKQFADFYKGVLAGGFYCLNTSDIDEAYEYLETGHAIRFAKEGEVMPNMEVKFIKDRKDKYILDNPVMVAIKNKKLNIAPIESQIVYKRYQLKSNKDLEDARHLEALFNGKLNREKLKLFESWWKNG